LLAEVHEMITRKVAKIIGLQQREMETLLKAVSSPEQSAPQGVSLRRRLSYRRFYSPEWILNAALEARKLYVKNRKEEAMAVLGLAIYFSQELISGGYGIFRARKKEFSPREAEALISEKSIKECVESFKPSLSYIQREIAKWTGKRKDEREKIGAAACLTSTLIMTALYPGPAKIAEIGRECKKLKEDAEKSKTARKYSAWINATAQATVLSLVALSYFSAVLAVVALMAGASILAILLSKKKNYIKKSLSKKGECSSYDEKAADFLLYP